jgi:hypothetical protein
MSNDNDFVATKAEQTFDDDGNTKVAEVINPNKKNLNPIRQIGNDNVSSKAKDKFSVEKLLGSKQKPAKVIQLKPKG